MNADRRWIDSLKYEFAEALVKEALIRRLLAEAVEEGRVKIVGFDVQGEPIYQGTGQAPPRKTP